MSAVDIPILSGAALALLFAAFTVLYDCHVSIQDILKRVPLPIYRERPAIAVALACGLVAAVAFFFTNGRGDSLVDSVLSLKQTNPYLRGLSVGLMVLVLIRSKLSNFEGAAIGGEWAYNKGREWVVESLNTKWWAFKTAYCNRNLPSALASFPDPAFETQVLAGIQAIIQVKPQLYQVFVQSQITNVVKSRPSIPFDPASVQWEIYYRTLMNLALDYAGDAVFSGWKNFS